MIHNYNHMLFDGKEKNIWHIHGEACTPGTMVMGNYYYGKRLQKIQNYISNRMSVLKVAYEKKTEFLPKSWIDYFLLGDVYVDGFGLDFSELDFWWLVCCKKRHFKDTQIVVFEPNIKDEIRLMLEAYDVKFAIYNKTDEKDYYREFHKKVFNNISKNIR